MKVNDRPSKGFLLSVLPLAALVVCFGFGLLPEVDKIETQPVPGEIVFKHEKPQASTGTTVSVKKVAPSDWLTEWLEQGYENLMRWEHNPWKQEHRDGFGDHFFKLSQSKDPMDQARCRELRRLADAWQQKLMLRFPELAVTMKTVPDDKNGFLQWLDLRDRLKSSHPELVDGITFPRELSDYLSHTDAWNSAAAQAWLAQNQALVDEIHAIGLMREQSINGIPIERWGFMDARFAMDGERILTLEARVAAERGDAAAALESVRSARGMADHLSGVETPSLLAITVNLLMRLNLEHEVLSGIIPALPPGQMDPAAWENAVNPTVSNPSEFARIMKGEWAVTNRSLLLPALLDGEDPKCPTDGGELLDYYSEGFVETVRSHESATLGDLPTLTILPVGDASHLSRQSQEAVSIITIGALAWRKGWDRVQSQSAMTQAAFAIMKGEPIPPDPVYGQPYRWDPATRQLSMPAGKAFDDLAIPPISVPRR